MRDIMSSLKCFSSAICNSVDIGAILEVGAGVTNYPQWERD